MDNVTVFTDAQYMSRIHPDMFEVPCFEDLDSLKPKDFIKVSSGGERFWCKILELKHDGLLHVKVDNVLTYSDVHGLFLDDEIMVSRSNVYEINNG